jgi:hypothetical protein
MAFIGSKGMISWDEENKTIKVITDIMEGQLDELHSFDTDFKYRIQSFAK